MPVLVDGRVAVGLLRRAGQGRVREVLAFVDRRRAGHGSGGRIRESDEHAARSSTERDGGRTSQAGGSLHQSMAPLRPNARARDDGAVAALVRAVVSRQAHSCTVTSGTKRATGGQYRSAPASSNYIRLNSAVSNGCWAYALPEQQPAHPCRGELPGAAACRWQVPRHGTSRTSPRHAFGHPQRGSCHNTSSCSRLELTPDQWTCSPGPACSLLTRIPGPPTSLNRATNRTSACVSPIEERQESFLCLAPGPEGLA